MIVMRSACLVFALVAESAAASSLNIKVPDASAFSPIAIPSVPLIETPFALELIATCKVVTSIRAPANGQFHATDLASPTKSTQDAALQNLAGTCSRLSSVAQLSATDLSNLREFRKEPSRTRAAVQDLVTKSRATPQGADVLSSTSAGSFEAAIINGITQFVYERAKAEAEMYTAKQLSTLMCQASEGFDPRPFFTNLCAAFGNVDAKLSLAAMASYLAAAARRDLERMPDVSLVYAAAQLDDTNDAKGAGREFLYGARLGLAYYLAVSSGRTPLDVARSLHAATSSADERAKRVFEAVGFASEIVDAVTRQRGWQKLAETTPDALEGSSFALGVLLSVEEMEGPKPFSKADMTIVAANIPLVVRFVIDTATLNSRVEQMIAQISRPQEVPSGGWQGATPSQEPGPRRLSLTDYAIATTQVLDRTLQDGVALGVALNVLDSTSSSRAQDARTVLQLGEEIVTRDLAALVLTAAAKLPELTAKVGAPGDLSRLFDRIRAIAPVVTELAKAKSADEVRAVLQAAAAPPSSFETKYKGPVVALNALVGVAAGTEGVENNGLRWGGFAGAFAPVGVHATARICDRFHVGAFVSVINLGALVSARFKSDTSGGPSKVQTDPNVSFKNVLSPGAFITLGLFGSPFMLGGGVQAVPASREIQTTDANGTRSSSAAGVQVLGLLAVDVPLFMF